MNFIFIENHHKNQQLYGDLKLSKHGRMRATKNPVEPIVLPVDSLVKFYGDRRWWTVKAAEGDYVVLSRSKEFGREGHYYTIIAWNEGRRGPHNLFGLPNETGNEFETILRGMLSGKLQLSERRSIHLDVEDTRA